jgi:chaperonin GroES
MSANTAYPHRERRNERFGYASLTDILHFTKGEVTLLIRPLGDKVVVKPSEGEEMTAGGIVLPDTAKKKPQEGEVVAVGPGRLLDDGSRSKPAVEVGQTVIYAKYGGNEVRVDGEDYIILDEESIYCVRE